MKNISLVIPIICCIILSCQQNSDSASFNNDNAVSHVSESEMEYTKIFPEYGFSIKVPCKLKDVSAHSSGDFLLNLGGVTDENDMQKMAAYQFIVARLPVGYKNFSKTELSKRIDNMLRQQTSHFKNVEAIRVGYEGFPGYVGYTTHNGLLQKGMIFAVNNYIVAMTVMTNNDLEAKFNKFSNGFKIIK
ncbi:MAG: hypothetical protein K2N03_03650 [Muribaculaceae bacterium]|nr:hypothetical protein [Muribaculaceae bacterium]